jgi:short-subunit dehydrogenase
MISQIRGKTVLLTGGSRGIGPFIARALAREGANLSIVALDAKPLETVAKELIGLGVRAISISGDITRASDRAAIVEQTKKEFGQIDILINNAGIGNWGVFSKQTESDMSKVVDTNLIAPMFLTRAVLPEMLARKSGHIVNISSLAGKKGVPFEAVYSCSKGALAQWSNALRLELENTGVHVSLVFPGYISKVGMFAEYGVPAPKMAGSVTPESVSRAVVQSIHHNSVELILSPGPTRLLYALNELSPSLGDWILKVYGVVKLQRKLIQDHQ